MNYYNEIDPFAAQWLRNLIKAGYLPKGDVDERSITEVRAEDLKGYTQHHFFAGIGGWPLALRQAGWPDDKPVWTGSCPCQPFSQIGLQQGVNDERHLWPVWYELIKELKPPVVCGEQVASKAAEPWIDHVQTDLEAVDYAVAAVAFPAASVGSPHIRDRLYWVGYADQSGLEGLGRRHPPPLRHGAASVRPVAPAGDSHGLAGPGFSGETNGVWADADWLFCRDGKWRAVEPGTQPLADGVPGRVGLLRAYGNAIVVPQAVEFILASEEAWNDR